MITTTKIIVGNENKLIGEINGKEYCISYNRNIYDDLQKLSQKIDLCETIEQYNNVIKVANELIEDKPYLINNSKYFAKINDDFFLTDGKKYYNIQGKNNIVNNILGYYLDKGLNLDKFASFFVRKGNPEILELNNIYHKLNRNGNIFCSVTSSFRAYNHFFKLDTKNNKIITETCSTRYFKNGGLIKSNTYYSLKALGSSIEKVIEENENLEEDSMYKLSVLIKPDLQCFIGDLNENNLIIDPDDKIDWDSYILSFINKYGK